MRCALLPATGEEGDAVGVAVRGNGQSAPFTASARPMQQATLSHATLSLTASIAAASLVCAPVRPDALRVSAELTRLFTKGEAARGQSASRKWPGRRGSRPTRSLHTHTSPRHLRCAHALCVRAELLHRAALIARTRDGGSAVDVADLERVLIQQTLDFKQ